MSAEINRTPDQPKRVLLVVSSPAVSTTVGGPVGFWGSELTHPWYELTEAGFAVELASPRGGKVELDLYSDPRHESGYSAHDLLTRGFLETPHTAALLADTRRVADCREEDYAAIVVAGGQGPLFTFEAETALHELFLRFYDAQKPSAALCHGTCLLLYLRRADGTPFLEGKTLTGFANVEEDYADRFVGTRVSPIRIEDEAKKLGANFVTGGLFKPFAMRDGRLITGQQQYSGRATARLVIEALGI